LDEINRYLEQINPGAADRIEEALITEIETIVTNPMLSNPIPGLLPQYRKWLVLGDRYTVYFERITQDSVKILRVRGARRKPLTKGQILGKN